MDFGYLDHPPYPPHKSWKIELNVKYWKVFVRNRTSSLEHDFPRHSYKFGMEVYWSMYVWKSSQADEFWISRSPTVPPLTNLQKIELNIKYWKVFVRNRTSSLEQDFPRHTYKLGKQPYKLGKHTYMLAEWFWKRLTGRGVSKKPDRQRCFEKASQAEGFLKSPTGRAVLKKRHRQMSFGYPGHPQYPPSRISKKLN